MVRYVAHKQWQGPHQRLWWLTLPCEERKYMFPDVYAFTVSREGYLFDRALSGTYEKALYSAPQHTYVSCFFLLADSQHHAKEAARPRPERI